MGMIPTVRLRHPVIILARGHGRRLAPVARGAHKTTEQVAGRPILAWILHELQGVACPTLAVHLREPDPDAARITATHRQPVLIDTGPPSGYLLDVHACTRYGERFTVLEADTVCYPGALRNFLILADQLGDHHDLCVGVAPAAANPHGPAVLADRDGLVTAMRWHTRPTGLVPLGGWHWSARLLASAPSFAQHTGSTSTAEFVTWTVQHGATVAAIGIPAGFNINTPTDLAAAHTGAANWLTHPQPSTDRSLAS